MHPDDTKQDQQVDVSEGDIVGRAHWLGYMFILFTCLLFSVNVISMRTVTSIYGVPSDTVLFIMSIVMTTLSVIYLLINGKVRRSMFQLSKAHLLRTVVRGIVGSVNTLLLYISIRLIPAGQADAAYFATPAFTLLFAAASLRERVRRADVFLACGSFLGILMICSPAFSSKMAPMTANNVDVQSQRVMRVLGVLSALGSALFNAAGFVITRSVSHHVHFMHLVFALSVCCFILTSLVGGSVNPVTLHETNPHGLFLSIFCGIVVFLAQTFMHVGLKFVPAGRGSLVRNCEVPLVNILGILFLGETPTLMPLLGAIVVVASSVAIGVRELKRN